jgi:hypothetical protein
MCEKQKQVVVHKIELNQEAGYTIRFVAICLCMAFFSIGFIFI